MAGLLCLPAIVLLVLLAGSSVVGERTVDVANGAGLAAALCDDSVDEARVTTDVSLTDADFQGLPTTSLRTRSLRVTGVNVAGGDWPLLRCVRPFARARVALATNVTLRFEFITLYRCRDGYVTRIPGLDFLAPSPGALLESHATFLLYDACFPMRLSLEDQKRLPRPPELWGNGKQLAVQVFPDDNCTRDTTSVMEDPWDVFHASLKRTGIANRCWAGMVSTMDVAMFGADLAVGGATTPNGYYWRISQSTLACRFVVNESCIVALGLVGCSNLGITNISQVRAQFGGLDYYPIQNGIPAPSGPQQLSSSGGDSGSSENVQAILIGSIIGGCVLLLLVLLVAAVWVRRGRRKDAGESTGAVAGGARDKYPGPTVMIVTSSGGLAGSSPATTVSADVPPAKRVHMLDDAPVTQATPYRVDVQTALQLREGELELLPETLGKGAYGRVVLGRYRGAPVAVKEIEVGFLAAPDAAAAASDDYKRQVKALQMEVEILARVSHPNVLVLLAASLKPPRPMLVTELMETSLEGLLYGKGGGELLPLRKVFHIGLQVAQALAYLHPTIIHRDIKPANVLLSQSNSDFPIVKIADFGLARLLTSMLYTCNPEVGTLPYMAPETFDVQNTVITDKCDVYSLAIILWEMLSGRRPWDSARHLVQLAYQVSVNGGRPPLNDIPEGRCPIKVRMLICKCWDADPLRRPAAAEVVKSLALVMEALARDGTR